MLSTPLEKARRAGDAWAIRSQRVATPTGIRPAAVVVRGETIVAVVPFGDVSADLPLDDVGDLAVLPGLVDAHVHINEPGRTDWEGFDSATRAAAAGGITTLVDMPLNSSPVTTTVAALDEKVAACQGKLWVDCGFHGGVVPGNEPHRKPLIDAGVLGLKAFLCHSGIDEFPAAAEDDIRQTLAILGDVPLLAHAEWIAPLPPSVEAAFAKSPTSYSAYLASRPAEWEHSAIERLVAWGQRSNSRIHIVHLASADALPMIAEARATGMPLTVETCPHYLYFAAEEIPDGDTRFKCAPPIRSRDHRERLWAGLMSGLIDTIGSDHSPAPPELKHLDTGDLSRAWGGIASLQVSLSAVWTEAHRCGLSLAEIVRWMCQNPARLVGLEGRKGSLAPGCDADLVVFDPEAHWRVVGNQLHHRHKATPYDGLTLRGRVLTTIIRGQVVVDETGIVGEPTGRPILRSRR